MRRRRAGTSTLTLNGGGVTNTELLEATAGGVLVDHGNTVDNAGANITVSGATSAVEHRSTVPPITGGTLNTAGGGAWRSTPVLRQHARRPDAEHRQHLYGERQHHDVSAGHRS